MEAPAARVHGWLSNFRLRARAPVVSAFPVTMWSAKAPAALTPTVEIFPRKLPFPSVFWEYLDSRREPGKPAPWHD